MELDPSHFLAREKIGLVRAKLGDFESAEKTFRALVKGLMAHRRKTIRNNIKHLRPTGVSPERIREALEELNIDPSRRAETLSVDEFAELGRICASPA